MSLEAKHQQSRRCSVLRLRTAWEDITTRHAPNHLNPSLPQRRKSHAILEHQDDIIDLATMEIVTDRGVLRGFKNGFAQIGYFSSDYESDHDDQEEEDEEEDVLGDWLSGLDQPSLSSRIKEREREEQRQDLRQFMERESRNVSLAPSNSDSAERNQVQHNFNLQTQESQPSTRERGGNEEWQMSEEEEDDGDDELAIVPIPSSAIRSHSRFSSPRTTLSSPSSSKRPIHSLPSRSVLDQTRTKLESPPPRQIVSLALSSTDNQLKRSSKQHSRSTSQGKRNAALNSSPLRNSFPSLSSSSSPLDSRINQRSTSIKPSRAELAKISSSSPMRMRRETSVKPSLQSLTRVIGSSGSERGRGSPLRQEIVRGKENQVLLRKNLSSPQQKLTKPFISPPTLIRSNFNLNPKINSAAFDEKIEKGLMMVGENKRISPRLHGIEPIKGLASPSLKFLKQLAANPPPAPPPSATPFAPSSPLIRNFKTGGKRESETSEEQGTGQIRGSQGGGLKRLYHLPSYSSPLGVEGSGGKQLLRLNQGGVEGREIKERKRIKRSDTPGFGDLTYIPPSSIARRSSTTQRHLIHPPLRSSRSNPPVGVFDERGRGEEEQGDESDDELLLTSTSGGGFSNPPSGGIVGRPRRRQKRKERGESLINLGVIILVESDDELML